VTIVNRMRLLRVWSAVGCADVTGGVAGGWLRRDGDMTTVGCNETDETWYLACRDGRWVGNITGCGTGAGHTATGRSQSLQSFTCTSSGSCSGRIAVDTDWLDSEKTGNRMPVKRLQADFW